MKTAREAYDETTKVLKAYSEGDLLGGNPMRPIEDYVNERVSQYVERQELAVATHDNHVNIIKQLEASMALESSKCIQSLEMKDERIKELEKLVVIMHVEKHPHLTTEQEIIIKQL